MELETPKAADHGERSGGSDLRWPAQIIVGKRHRKEFGDLEALARSINERGGLIHPIAITAADELIAGERRLKAWQLPACRFHDQPIPVMVFDVDSIVAGESDENDPNLRKNFTLTESVAIARALEPRLQAQAKERQREHGGTAPGRKAQHSGQVATSDGVVSAKGNALTAEKGRARDLIAKATGKGARTLDKAKAIVAAAESDPERFGKLQSQMDRTGRADGPYKRLRNIIAADAIKAEPPSLPIGPYRAGIIDIPWASEPDDGEKDHGARGYYPYPTLTPDQAAALPVPSILHADASVWLWITNFHLMHGHHLTIAKAWGLRPVALLTWVKRKFGQGQRVRGATEHLIQLIRGDVLALGSDTKTWFEGESRVHSQKPPEAYEIVEKLSPASRYFEMFSRGGPRDKWDFHGNEVGKLATPEPSVDRREAARQRAKAQWADPKARELARQRAKEQWANPDQRKRKSDGLKTWHKQPGVREHRSAAIKAAFTKPGKREQHAATVKAALASPETRKRMSEGTRAGMARAKAAKQGGQS